MNDKYLNASEPSGVFFLAAEARQSVEASAARQHLIPLVTHLGQQDTIASALRKIGDDLAFPIWYGTNFDALFDCLTDPDWQPAKGHVLLIDGIEALRLANPENFTTLLEVFQAVAEHRSNSGKPFWVMIDTPALGIKKFPA